METAMKIYRHSVSCLALGLALCGCVSTGSGRSGADAGQTSNADAEDDPTAPLATSFRWTSTDPIIAPITDSSHDLVAIKDPSVVFFNDSWHVYATSVGTGGIYGMVYLNFSDFDDPASGTLYYMDQTPGFNTYVAAPELFYFAPQDRWYLVFQSGPPMYSTNDDPSHPEAWTRPARFFASEPSIITENGGWLDFWVICDDETCSLFFSDDHGRWYRSVTSVADFPSGFSDPAIVLEDADAGRLFEASNVYKVRGQDQYLALIEAFDSTSNWKRYFRSFTAESLDGPWQPLQDAGPTPFAGPANVDFAGEAWTANISHGEMLRDGFDQTLTIDPNNLQYLYQGVPPGFAGVDYNSLPWNLGLLSLAP